MAKWKNRAGCIYLCFSFLLVASGFFGCGSDSSSGPDDPDNPVIGETWTVRTPSALDGMDDICWAGDKFVAVGTSAPNLPAVSSDGTSWQSISGTFEAQNVAYYNGHIVAGEFRCLWHSQDGMSWDTVFIPAQTTLGLFTDYDGFVTWKNNSPGYDILKSADGMTWSETPEPSPLWRRKAIAATAEHTVEVGVDGTVRHNGSIVSGLSGFNDVIYTGSGFVLVGQNGSAKSTNGISWTQYPSLELNCLAYTGSLFVALGPQEEDSSIISTVYTSLDAISWTQKYRDNIGPWGLSPKIVYGANRIIIDIQDGGILTSP